MVSLLDFIKSTSLTDDIQDVRPSARTVDVKAGLLAPSEGGGVVRPLRTPLAIRACVNGLLDSNKYSIESLYSPHNSDSSSDKINTKYIILKVMTSTAESCM